MCLPTIDAATMAAAIVYREKLHHLEEAAVGCLANRSGLAMIALWPPSTVIHIVALDGVHIGGVRRETHPDGQQWFAVPLASWRTQGPFPTESRAAREPTRCIPAREGLVTPIDESEVAPRVHA